MKPRITVIDRSPWIDSVAIRTLEQAVRFYGMRTMLKALVQICDDRAARATENFNTVTAKQWAAWAADLETMSKDRTLIDPGRD